MTAFDTGPIIALRDRLSVDMALLVVRVTVGVIFIAHGAQKMFGAFDGLGLAGTMGEKGPGGGGIVGLLVAIGEFFGGCGLVAGFLSRFSAASIILIMAGAIVMVHGKNGFFSRSGGYEYNLALIGLAAAVLLAGPGRFAIGRFLPLLPKSAATGRPVLPLE